MKCLVTGTEMHSWSSLEPRSYKAHKKHIFADMYTWQLGGWTLFIVQCNVALRLPRLLGCVCSVWLTVCGCHYLITVQLKIKISFVGVQTDVAFLLHILITHSVVCNGIYNMKNTSLDFF